MGARPRGRKQTVQERAAYQKQWRVDHPAYDKQYRVDHKAQQRASHQEWKAYHQDLVREQKRRYAALHPRVLPVSEVPVKFIGHPFFETARFICGEEPYWDWYLRWEEMMGDVVLALLEGRDPTHAREATFDRERIWHSRNMPLYSNVDMDEEHRVVYMSRDD